MEERRRQELLDERKALDANCSTSASHFDKAMLTLSSAALGLSVTFIRDIAPSPRPCSVLVLAASWIAFAGSMLMTLASFLTSQAACQRQIEIIHDLLVENERGVGRNVWRTTTSFMNIGSIVLFSIGTILLICFVLWNLGTVGVSK